MMAGGRRFLRPLVRSVIQEFLEAEMPTAIGAEKGERGPLTGMETRPP